MKKTTHFFIGFFLFSILGLCLLSCNDNAKKLLEELQLEYNKLRQQSITTELLDILGGQKRD